MDTFSAVQDKLAAAAIQRREPVRNRVFILAGLLHDDAGNHMSPSHANKKGVRYRYVSQALLQHRKAEAGSIARVSAPKVEAAITGAFSSDRTELRNRIWRIMLYRDRLAVELKPSEGDPTPAPVTIPFVWQPQGRRKGIAHEPSQRPRLDPNASRAVLMAIGRARRWMAKLIDGSSSIKDIAAREEMGDRNVRRLLPLACLSPTLIRAIADGTAPANLTITSLTAALPHDWATQEQRFLSV